MSGSFLVDHKSSGYILKSNFLMAQSMLVAPFMNRKYFALLLSLERHLLRLAVFSGLLERALANHNTITLFS